MPHKSNNPTILIVVNRLFEWSQNFITRELVELARQGAHVVVCAREIVARDDLTSQEKSLENDFLLIPENPFNPRPLCKALRFLIAHPTLLPRVCKAFFELEHFSMAKRARSIVCLFRAAAIARFCLRQKIQLVHAHFLTAPAETAFYLSIFTGIPFSATGYAMDIYQDDSGLKRKLQKAAFINTHTRFNMKYLLDRVDPALQNLTTFHTGIDYRPIIPKSMARKDETVFLAVGRLVEKKGFDSLITACQLLREKEISIRCILVGKGPLTARLRKKVSCLNLDDVIEMKDYVEPNKLHEVYQDCDVLVVPSVIADDKDIDGLPTVCFEAMAFGLPVIGSDLSGIPEAVIDGRNGDLIEPGNAQAIAEAMIKLTAFSLRKQMSEQARRIASEKFDLRKNVNSLKLKMEQAITERQGIMPTI